MDVDVVKKTLGEFKKRIQEANRIAVTDGTGNQCWMGEIELFKIFEDAKKELKADILTIVESFKQPYRAVSPEVIRLVETFNKWFGSEEVKK